MQEHVRRIGGAERDPSTTTKTGSIARVVEVAVHLARDLGRIVGRPEADAFGFAPQCESFIIFGSWRWLRRDFRTAHLHALIVEKGYEAVTVQDIIDRANVGSTFYAHYTDKQQLLVSHFADLEAHLSEQQRLIRAKSADPAERVFGFSLAMFQHAQEYPRLWDAVVGKQTGVAIVRRIEGILEKIVGREIASLAPRGASPQVPPGVITRCVVTSLLGLLTWWLNEGSRYWAEEVDGMFRVLVKPGIAAALRSG